MTAGERRLMVLHGRPGELYSYSPCVASGVLGTDAGDAALAEAIATFGEGRGPPTPDPTSSPPPSATEPGPTLSAGLLWVAAALGAAGLLFAGIVLVAVRSKPR